MKVIWKFVYGGTFVDKYFVRLEDNTVLQLPEREYNLIAIGDDYTTTDPEQLRPEHTERGE